MATIGHTLAGLSLAGCSSPETQGGTPRHLWPAFVVLLAHMVDLVEWAAAIIPGASANSHFLTHSPFATAILVLLIWVALAIGTKLRSPLAYVIVAAAVFSHLLLDLPSLRFFIARAYDGGGTYDLPQLGQSLVAEIWLFGLVFVLISLGRAVLQPTCPKKGSAVGAVLMLAALAAAASRHAALWAPAYLVSLTHAAILLRSRFDVRQLWGIVVVLPVLAFVLVEGMAAHLTATGISLMRAGHDREAIEVYQRVFDLPTRESHAWNHTLIGQCYQNLGEPAPAEAAFIAGVESAESPAWPMIYLARFYALPKWQGTRFFKPEKAEALLEEARTRPRDPRILPGTTKLLADLKARGSAN